MHCWVQRDKAEFVLPGMVKQVVHHQLPLAPGSIPGPVLGRWVGERRSGEAQSQDVAGLLGTQGFIKHNKHRSATLTFAGLIPISILV